MILILPPARRKIYLHYRTRLISSFNHLICLPLLFLHRWKVRNNVVRGRVRWPDLAPWTICLYHKSVRRNGSDREKIFLCLQRAETRKTRLSDRSLLLFSSFNSRKSPCHSYHPLTPMYKPNCNMEFASSGLPSKECTTPGVNSFLCFLRIRTKSSLALRQCRNIGSFSVEHNDNCSSKYFFWVSLGQKFSLS